MHALHACMHICTNIHTHTHTNIHYTDIEVYIHRYTESNYIRTHMHTCMHNTHAHIYKCKHYYKHDNRNAHMHTTHTVHARTHNWPGVMSASVRWHCRLYHTCASETKVPNSNASIETLVNMWIWAPIVSHSACTRACMHVRSTYPEGVVFGRISAHRTPPYRCRHFIHG